MKLILHFNNEVIELNIKEIKAGSKEFDIQIKQEVANQLELIILVYFFN